MKRENGYGNFQDINLQTFYINISKSLLVAFKYKKNLHFNPVIFEILNEIILFACPHLDEQPAGNNNSENTINANGRPMDAHHHQISQLQQQQPPSNYGPESNRQQFYRSMPYDGPPQQQQPSSQQQMQGPRAGMRFHSNNNGRNDFYQPMRPPHMMSDNNFPMHRMNFGPPPPPPPPQQNQHHLYPRGPPQARYRGQW